MAPAMRTLVVAAVFLLELCLPAMALSGRAAVVDGDSLRIGRAMVRLHGIDAPEWRQYCTIRGRSWACGKAAAAALRRRLGSDVIRCRVRGSDSGGRLLAVCFHQGTEVNDWLVRNGLAVAFRRYSLAYVAAEDEARKARRGLWRGKFVKPWVWRQRRRK